MRKYSNEPFKACRLLAAKTAKGLTKAKKKVL